MTYASPSTINASRGLPELMGYINTVTGGWISNMILLGIYFIVIFGYYKSSNDFWGAMAVSGYVTFVIGLLFWIGGFVSPVSFGFSIGMAIIGTLVLFLDHS